MSESYISGDTLSEAGSCTNLSVISDASSSVSISNMTSTGTASNSSTSSKIGTVSGLPRPSGLKQPTKLNRMCGGSQKPPVPLSPKSSKLNFHYFLFTNHYF